MPDFEYKTYCPEFAVGVQSVALESWKNTYQGIFDEAFINNFVQRNYSAGALNNSIARIAEGREFFEVALDAGRVIGYCHMGDGGKGWELFRIYISPRYIGQGVGKTLSMHGEMFLRSKGASRYFCFVHEKNELGKNFYQRSGFQHIPAKDQDDEWYMEKNIEP